MLISTIIICRNARPFIESCVASIRGQAGNEVELVAIDGHSQDGTLEWLRQQADIRTYTQQGTGIANARNEGLKASSGDYISFLDADDAWMPHKLNQQRLLLQQNTTLQAVTGQLIKSNDVHETTWVAMTPGGFLFRREVFEEFGLFNEQWQVASDHDWLIRAIRNGLRYQVQADTVLIKGMHDRNLSVLQKKRYRAEMMTIMRQY